MLQIRLVIQSALTQMKVRKNILLRFPEHAVTVSESIKGNFHQISLFPVDKPVLRLFWTDMQAAEESGFISRHLPLGTQNVIPAV